MFAGATQVMRLSGIMECVRRAFEALWRFIGAVLGMYKRIMDLWTYNVFGRVLESIQ